MSNFKVGDWVVRCINVQTGGVNLCESGKPVQIVSIDNTGWLTFSEKEGGDGWNYDFFREATGEDFQEYEMLVPSAYKTQRTLEDVKLDLANKLEEVERLKKELEEIENPVLSVSISKKQVEDFVYQWGCYIQDADSYGSTGKIYEILVQSLEQHNAKASQ